MSQVVAFTFGSFGDIFTILSLVCSVQRLLSNASGASVECHMLAEYLDTFRSTVEIVRTLAFDASIDPASTVTQSRNTAPSLSKPKYRPAANAILCALSVCYRLLADFESKFAPYETTLVSSRPSNPLVVLWRKVSWTSVQDEALALRRNLEGQLHCINVILSILALHSPQTAHRCLPAGVWVTDILNVKILVPTEWCRNREEFHQYLHHFFYDHNRKGKTLIARHKYTLEAEASSGLISPETWADHAQAGKHIFMSAIVERAKDADPHVCPSCTTKNHVGFVVADMEIQCCSCGATFKAVVLPNSNTKLFASRENNAISPGSPHAAQYPSPDFLKPLGNRDSKTEEDMSFIRRVSLVVATRSLNMLRDDRLPCSKCDKTFSCAHDRKRHYATTHTSNPPVHTCRFCKKGFSRGDSLKRHINNGCDLDPSFSGPGP